MTRISLRRALNSAVAAVALLAAPYGVAAQTAAVAAPVAAAPVQTVDADPALWVVKDKDTTIYLFGTVHLMKPGYTWFDEAVKTAFDASSEVAFEIENPADLMSQVSVILPLAMDQEGRTLKSALDADTHAKLVKALTNSGMPAAAFERFEPWFVAMALAMAPLQKMGMDPKLGVDATLHAAAKSAGKKVIGLETVEQQLAIFDTLPRDQQIAYLKETLTALDKNDDMVKLMETMLAAWAEGDVNALAKLDKSELSSNAALNTKLLDDRNRNWAEWLDNRMDQPGTVFVAVGALHMPGKVGVVQLMKDRKFKVKRVKY